MRTVLRWEADEASQKVLNAALEYWELDWIGVLIGLH